MTAEGALARRTRDAAGKRREILAAAKVRFAQDNYDRVGLRQIAMDVGVDVALVARYFGSKEKLFDEVLNRTLSIEPILREAKRESFGADMARKLMGSATHSAEREYFMLLLRASTAPAALERVHRKVDTLLIGPMADWLGGRDAALRTKLLITIMTGMSVQSLITTGVASLTRQDLRLFERITARAMQRIVDDAHIVSAVLPAPPGAPPPARTRRATPPRYASRRGRR